MPITALYAGILAPLFLLLTFRVVFGRQKARVGIGDGGDAQLIRRIRVHGNFCETVPYALILMLLAESMKSPRPALHLAGICLVFGRLLHAYGVSQDKETLAYRVTGMSLTFLAIAIAAINCLIYALGYFL